jgi:small subunit ribosomal protein S17
MPRRILEGKVLSAKQDKTVTVLVESRFMHPIYKKYLKKSKKFAAHDEANTAQEGDTIRIIECAPISKNKRFTVYTGAENTAPAKTEETKKPAVKKAAPKKEAEAREEKKPAANKETTKKAPAKKSAAKKKDDK